MQGDKNEFEVFSSKRGKREGVIPNPVSNEHDTRAKVPFMLFLKNSTVGAESISLFFRKL